MAGTISGVLMDMVAGRVRSSNQRSVPYCKDQCDRLRLDVDKIITSSCIGVMDMFARLTEKLAMHKGIHVHLVIVFQDCKQIMTKHNAEGFG